MPRLSIDEIADLANTELIAEKEHAPFMSATHEAAATLRLAEAVIVSAAEIVEESERARAASVLQQRDLVLELGKLRAAVNSVSSIIAAEGNDNRLVAGAIVKGVGDLVKELKGLREDLAAEEPIPL